MQNSESIDRAFYSSVVLEYIVPKLKTGAFRRWHSLLLKTAEQHPGFVRNDLCPPLECVDDVVKWYTIMHFDTPDHLNNWLESDDRDRVTKSGRSLFQNYKFLSFTTGLEGWFSTQSGTERSSLGPPAWKQVLSVVLGLYPIVMIQGKVFGAIGLMKSWSPASAMLINNLITSSLLTWAVMPQITKLFRFWLQPAFRGSQLRTDLIGSALVFVAYAVLVLMFSAIA